MSWDLRPYKRPLEEWELHAAARKLMPGLYRQ